MVAEDDDMSADSSPSRQVTVVDVYDLASAIGKDFERIIDHFGSDSVANLMPKVISALEFLEAFAGRNERENEEIEDLKVAVHRLEADKEQKQECKKKFDRELEQIEDNYRNEIKQLWDIVQRLQDENKRLNCVLEHKDQKSPTTASKEDDLSVMITLRETVDHQRDHMKQADQECRARQLELEKTQQQVEKLQRVNKELLRKNKAIQSQGRELVEEKADLISLLQERDHEIELLKLQLGETEKAKKDLEQSKIEQGCDRDNLPRFTLAELREVLQEKNHLKARVMELEEELAQLRPPVVPSPLPPEPKSEEEELLVYGPINKEPDEKLYPWRFGRKDSGVRKFFTRLWPSKSTLRSEASIRDSNNSRWTKRRTTSFGQSPNLHSSASSPRTTVVPIVHYRHVVASPSQQLSLRMCHDQSPSIGYSSLPNTLTSLSFSSLASNDELYTSNDSTFDGACIAQEFGESGR